jgi:hypothetical protein
MLLNSEEQLELYWLEVFSDLWDLYQKYHKDEYIVQRVQNLAWLLAYNLNLHPSTSGIIQLAKHHGDIAGKPAPESLEATAQVAMKRLAELLEKSKS